MYSKNFAMGSKKTLKIKESLTQHKHSNRSAYFQQHMRKEDQVNNMRGREANTTLDRRWHIRLSVLLAQCKAAQRF